MWLRLAIFVLWTAAPLLSRTSCSEVGLKCLNSTSISTPSPTSCRCSQHAFCYLGACLCHPGYNPSSHCSRKLSRLSPWLTKGCIALHNNITYDIDMPLISIGGEYHRQGSLCPKFMRHCAYLCFAHLSYGVAVVPKSLWRQAQKAEVSLWKEVSGSSYMDPSSNDRAEEHWLAFDYLSCLPRGMSLGSVVGEILQSYPAKFNSHDSRGGSWPLDTVQIIAALPI